MRDYAVEFTGLSIAAIIYLGIAIAVAEWPGVALACLCLFFDISIKKKVKNEPDQ